MSSELNDKPDLVERLRQQFPDVPYHRDKLHLDAADEIERLRAEVAKLQEPVEDMAAWRLRFCGAVAKVEAAERERIAKQFDGIYACCCAVAYAGGDIAQSIRRA